MWGFAVARSVVVEKLRTVDWLLTSRRTGAHQADSPDRSMSSMSYTVMTVVSSMSSSGSEASLDRQTEQPRLQDLRRLSERRTVGRVLGLDVARVGRVEDIDLSGVLHVLEPE
jgi:hypothetical protein